LGATGIKAVHKYVGEIESSTRLKAAHKMLMKLTPTLSSKLLIYLIDDSCNDLETMFTSTLATRQINKKQ